MALLSIMGKIGDERITWNPDDPTDVDEARQKFNRAKAEGLWAYAVKRTGEKGQVIQEFDPNAEKIIMAPPMRGG